MRIHWQEAGKDEKIAFLHEMHFKRGFSYSNLALHSVDGQCDRSAIAGFVYRNQDAFNTATPVMRRDRAVQVAKVQHIRSGKPKSTKTRAKPAAAIIKDESDAGPSSSTNVAFLDRTRNQCAWIVDTAARIVCGARIEDGSSYCPHHHSIAVIRTFPAIDLQRGRRS